MRKINGRSGPFYCCFHNAGIILKDIHCSGVEPMQTKVANNADYPPIAICFRDLEISYLFAELIEAEGYRAEIVTDLSNLQATTRIITESSLVNSLPSMTDINCLVVGDSASKVPARAIPLIRPLSEDKIDSAFSRFLPKR